MALKKELGRENIGRRCCSFYKANAEGSHNSSIQMCFFSFFASVYLNFECRYLDFGFQFVKQF